MMADGPKMRPVTYTISEADVEMLEQLIRWRHPNDPKPASMTIRECIRETYEREKAKQEGTGK